MNISFQLSTEIVSAINYILPPEKSLHFEFQTCNCNNSTTQFNQMRQEESHRTLAIRYMDTWRNAGI